MGKTIGILGGMGPAATIDLFQKIVLNTQAQTDQDHPRIIIYNNPKIPPRTLPFDRSFQSPLPGLIKSALKLEKAGADFIIMPCHTAHIWYSEIKKTISIPFYSMIENTVQTIIEQKSLGSKKILLFASETTINSRIYQNSFENSSFKLVIPQTGEQKVVDKAIKNVKAGKTTTNRYIHELNQILSVYREKGISKLLGGCTEISLIFPYFNLDMEKIDPTLMLAKLSIKKATL